MGSFEDGAGLRVRDAAGDPDGQIWMGLGKLGGEGFAVVVAAQRQDGLGLGSLEVG